MPSAIIGTPVRLQFDRSYENVTVNAENYTELQNQLE